MSRSSSSHLSRTWAGRPSHFHYERSGLINAPPEKIFPYLVEFHKGSEWSPYEKQDPQMTKTFAGTDGTVGSKMIFEGTKAGSGTLEIMKIEPNKSVDVLLHMVKPFKADHDVKYTLTPEGPATRFTWSMSGEGGFLSKFMTVIIDCDKMIAGQFTEGINNLKALIEAKP